MPKSIAVFGAGPGLGHAVARRQEPLELLAQELAGNGRGTTARVITADLADTDAIPALAEQIRAKVGHLSALYYAPTPQDGAKVESLLAAVSAAVEPS